MTATFPLPFRLVSNIKDFNDLIWSIEIISLPSSGLINLQSGTLPSLISSSSRSIFSAKKLAVKLKASFALQIP